MLDEFLLYKLEVERFKNQYFILINTTLFYSKILSGIINGSHINDYSLFIVFNNVYKYDNL